MPLEVQLLSQSSGIDQNRVILALLQPDNDASQCHSALLKNLSCHQIQKFSWTTPSIAPSDVSICKIVLGSQ